MSSVLTVSQLNRYVGFKIKSDVKLHGIAVKGEISNLSVNYKSGHMYFSLRDDDSIVRAVVFSQNAQKLKFYAQNGINVIAFGNVDVYERDGQYQIVVTDMQPLGSGKVQESLEVLKEKLAKLGVFDAENKRNIVKRPSKIAVVTSTSGAALQDILNVVKRRCPVCKVLVFPTLVQGSDAPEMIARSLAEADDFCADTIILARGGGSAEDLQAFNTEKVVMAVYNCKTPVISAVGHETDTTLSDYAADMRAPTPSAAAELAVPDISYVSADVDRYVKLAKILLNKKITACDNMVLTFDKIINSHSPVSVIKNKLSETDKTLEKLKTVFAMNIERLDKTLVREASKLSALNPFSVMERGYSVVTKNDETLNSSASLKNGDKINIRFFDGQAEAEII